MFLSNIHLYLADPATGRLEVRPVCEYCWREIAGEPLWQIRTRPFKLTFFCDDECKRLYDTEDAGLNNDLA